MSVSHGLTEITDPVEKMLQQTGCMKLHYKVQECIAKNQDWRTCQEEVKEFKSCMETYNNSKRSQIGG